MRVDSHQHFWNYSKKDYGWIPPGSPIEQSFAPADLKPLLQAAKLDSCIAVQARQTLEENDYLCNLALQHDFIAGVVGWIDLQSPQAAEQAHRFSEQTKAVGVRHVVQDESDPNFMARPEFRRGIGHLHSVGLVYDILIYEHQISDAISLVKAFPNQSFVIDHIAKPRIKTGSIESWRDGMRTLSQFPNVVVKISGMITEADHSQWQEKDLLPYLNSMMEYFTPDRLMFGSDWPVMNLAGSYQGWFHLIEKWSATWSESERNNLFGETARRIYRLTDSK